MIKNKALSLLLFIAISSSAFATNLESLIDEVSNRNLELKMSNLQIEQSFLDQKTAENALIPDVKFNVRRSHKTFKDSYQKSNPFSYDTTLAYTLSLTQSWPGLGKIPSVKKEITKLKTLVQKTTKEKARIRLLRSLTKTYFKWVRENELAKIHKTDLFLIGELLKVAKLNEEVGLVLKNDILRIEVEELNSKASLVEANNNLDNFKVDIANLLDYSTPASVTLEAPMSLKFTAHSFIGTATKKLLLENDQDLKLLTTDRNILRKSEKIARSAYLPTLSFDGSYNHGRKMGPIEGTKDVTATFILTTPVYDSGDIENSIRYIQKSRKIANLQLQNLTNQKSANITKALHDYKESLARISFAEKAIEQSLENMRIVFSRYQEGDASIVELVDAQRLLTNSAQTVVKRYYDERERVAEIYLQTNQIDKLKKLDKNPFPVNFNALIERLKLGENND
jgi:outer membrane protein TolC